MSNLCIECFYNKDGKWYYAGQYIALRLEDLTAKEWDNLSSEVSTIHYKLYKRFNIGLHRLLLLS